MLRIDVGFDPPQPARVERTLDHGRERFGSEAPAPIIRVEDEPDLRKAVEARLADHPTLVLDDEILSLGRIRRDHRLKPLPRLIERAVRRRRPISRCPRVAEDRVDGGKIALARRAQDQSSSSYLPHVQRV